MKLLTRLLCPALLAAAAACAAAPPEHEVMIPPPSVVIRNVTIIDVAGGPDLTHRNVLIMGGRILAIGSAREVPVPRRAQVVDGTGRFLVPGLWDVHAHVDFHGPPGLSLYLANGVTGIRDMGAMRFATVKGWRDSIAIGYVRGPRMRIAAPIVERAEWLTTVRRWMAEAGAPAGILEERFGPTSPGEAARWVDSVAALGADHVKVRNWPPEEISRALIARAAEHGLPVVGHANRPFPTRGVASYEHGVFPPLDLPDEERRALWRGFASEGSAYVPTLVAGMERLLPLDTLLARIDPAREPLYRYVPDRKLEEWRREYESRRNERPFDWEAVHRADLRNLAELRAAGVMVLAGSDAATPFVIPGFGLHDELELLVTRGGLTPLEALRGATLDPARFLGMADSLGTVEEGKLADLLVLDADPRVDVRNTRRIHAVVADGRLLDRRALDRLLAGVETAARAP
jgi:hypothetical protein